MMRRTHEDRSQANARSGLPESSSTASAWPSDTWALLSYYQRFEGLVALILTFLIGLIIVIALFRLTMGVITDLLFNALDPLDHAVFQTVFGEIMTLLIALEFNHTLQYMVARQQSIVQTSVLLLIALLALARKFILLDLHAVSRDASDA